jgi:hypothetical protein
MTKSKKRQKKGQEDQTSQFGWIPLWGWGLIFLVPLILSEFMFYRADRKVSMVLFLVAWTGFWVAMMHRSGWAILKKNKEE